MTSIRRSVTLCLLAGLGALVAATGVGLYLGGRTALTRLFDEALRTRAAALVSATRFDEGSVEMDVIPESMPWYEPGSRAEYFELRALGAGGEANEPDNPSRATLFRSASLEGEHLRPHDAAGCVDVRLPDGRPGRAVTLRFRPGPDDPGVPEEALAAAEAPQLLLVVARGREDLDRTLAMLGLALSLAGGAVALGIVVVVGLALSRGFRPLARLSAEVGSIDAGSLSRRLDDGALPAELRPVYTRLNELLGRLAAAFEREKRFTAAAAHELRTPIAELRSLLEVSLSRPRSPEDSRRSLEEALMVTVQMQRLIAALFTLARHQAGLDPPILVAVDVVPILRRVCDRHLAEARARSGDIRVESPPFAPVFAEESLLESTLDNVVANAVQHSEPSPTIEARVSHDGAGHICVQVANPVNGLSGAEVERFFEPFWRRSESRAERAHLGLGLTLAHRSALLCQGSLTAELAPTGVVNVRLRLRTPVAEPIAATPKTG